MWKCLLDSPRLDIRPVTLAAELFAMLMKGRIARPVEGLDDATAKAIAEAKVQPRSRR